MVQHYDAGTSAAASGSLRSTRLMFLRFTFMIYAIPETPSPSATGAKLRELMARMGHSSTRAALIYLHSTSERQREIADALGRPGVR
jgi:hypothetical protein